MIGSAIVTVTSNQDQQLVRYHNCNSHQTKTKSTECRDFCYYYCYFYYFKMGNQHSFTSSSSTWHDGRFSASELERIQRRLTRIGRGRPELAACDLRNMVPNNPFVDSIFELYDTGMVSSSSTLQPTNQPTTNICVQITMVSSCMGMFTIY